MSRLLFITAFCVIIPVCCIADGIGSLKSQVRGLNYTKAENNLILSWVRQTRNREKPQIEIYDPQGDVISTVNVLATVRTADKVSIWDVSARRDRRIAVAADFVGANGLVASLLYFDFKGHLLAATALAPSRDIRLLALDDDLTVWAVGTGSAEEDPSAVPLVFHYDSTGRLAKELIARNEFPADAQQVQEGYLVGSPMMGVSGQAIWFWLAGSKELVTIAKPSLSVSRTVTGLPQPPPSGTRQLAKLVRLPTGVLIGEFSDRYGLHGTASYTFYEWSPESPIWKSITPNECNNHFLIGVLNGEGAFIGFGSKEVCTASMSLQ